MSAESLGFTAFRGPMEWQGAILKHPECPASGQIVVLVCLSQTLNWKTGTGFASEPYLMRRSGVKIRTVRSALSWARQHGFAVRTRKGHRINDETAVASEWMLTMPATGEAEVGEEPTGNEVPDGEPVEEPTGKSLQPNRQIAATQPARTDPPSSVSRYSVSTTSSSARSAGDGDDVVLDAEAIRAGAAGDGASARASGGTAQADDHIQAENRPAGEAPSAMGSRAECDRQGREPARSAPRAERGTDGFQKLARSLTEVRGQEFQANLLVPRFRRVAAELAVSAEVTAEAVAWWLQEYAPSSFKHPDSVDEDRSKLVSNPGGYLNGILPDLIRAYLEARERQATELGLDPSGFDLCAWLLDQDEAAQRAECEAEAAHAAAAEAQQVEASARLQERQEAAQRTAQECQEIRALMETLVPHVAVVLNDDGDGVRKMYLSPTDTSSGKWRSIRDDDLAAWKDKARRLAKDFGDELPYAEKERPGDSDVVLARKFYDEMLADHSWLAA